MYKNIYLGCPDELAETRINPTETIYEYTHEKAVFFGHYWLRGKPVLDGSQAVCLDYSVAKDGKLVAYRWDGAELSEEQIVSV